MTMPDFFRSRLDQMIDLRHRAQRGRPARLHHVDVYLLLGPREDGEWERVYIGEGEPINPRLASQPLVA